MAPKSWQELARQIAREGDAEAADRQRLYRDQVNHCLDGMSQYTQETVREEIERGQLRRS